MSTGHKYRTAISVICEGVEYEWPMTVTYSRHHGYAGSQTEPSEPPSVEVEEIYMLDGSRKVHLPDLICDQLAEDSALIGALLSDWMDDHLSAMEARSEYLAERLRDD